MPLQVKCLNPACGSVLAIDENLVGSNSRCTACGTAFRVPAPRTVANCPAPSTILPTAAAKETLGGASPAASAKPSAALSPSQSIGRFEIRARLGAGAFGVVYRAFDPSLQREVALKVLHPEMLNHPDRVERFQREARAAAGLRHANIVAVFDIGQDGGQYYIASAYIPGQTLHDALNNKPMPFQRAARIVRDLADAVGYAHQQGVVHRDLKPANILLDEKDAPQLVDFGLSARQETESPDKSNRLTRFGAVLGTPAYMAPEQARGQTGELQPTADQYSLGVILYELLCGRPPFEGPPALVLYNVLNKEPATPSSVNASVPPELERICRKAMARRPEDRYADCEELADALCHWLDGQSPKNPIPVMIEPDKRSAALVDWTNVVKRDSSQLRPSAKSMRRLSVSWIVLGLTGLAAGVLFATAIVGVILLILWSKPQRNPSAGTPMANPAEQESKKETTPGKQKNRPQTLTPTLTIDLDGSTKMEFVLIPMGTFKMGSPPDELGRNSWEQRFDAEKQHAVEITQPFYLAKYPVTQDQYRALMNDNPSWFQAGRGGANEVQGLDTKQFPVENVSWNDAQAFCKKMGDIDQLRRQFRLPTEAEWEYACRAGTTTTYYFGSQLNGKEANCNGNYPYGTTDKGPNKGRTTKVGEYDENKWGLCDMHGNVEQMCEDYYGPCEGLPRQDPLRSMRYGDQGHVLRGGSWYDSPPRCRAASRSFIDQGQRYKFVGFRIVYRQD